MNFSIQTISPFERNFKRLLKKYPSLSKDIIPVLDYLEKHGQMGTPLGKDCFKIRMSISSKNSGKSGGARVIAMAKVEQTRVILLYIFDKSEEQSVSDKVLNELIKVADDMFQ